MDGGTQWATVHGVTRVGHNLATKRPPPPNSLPQTEHMRNFHAQVFSQHSAW